ncbi:hypothetical protein [Nocardia sp. NPDC049526]|uniref:hypothetical protein n=1 Tax=Nocardia sp. NPDC049526 TaxID=3364316 RepID=UPI0037AE40D2
MTETLDPTQESTDLSTDRPIAQAHSRSPVRQLVAQCSIMAYRSLLMVKHNPWRLMDVTLQPVIFLVIFTNLFGGALMGGVAGYLPGSSLVFWCRSSSAARR